MKGRWSRLVRVLLAVSILTAVGCASLAPSPPRDLVRTPGHWETEEASGNRIRFDEPWWRHFDEPALDAFMGEAMESNWELRRAAARLDAARSRARVAGAELKPRIEAGLDAARRRQNFLGIPLPGGEERVLSSTTTSLGLSLNLSWEIDLWGRARAVERAGRADADAARADLAAAGLSITGQVAKTWFAILEARQQRDLARATVRNREETARRVRLRYEQGLRSPLDLRLALSQEARARSALEQRTRLLDRLERQMAVLLGRYPRRLEDEAARLPDLPPPVPAGLPSELVRRRPDLAAAERRLAAAGYRVGEARALLYPALRLTASGGRSSEDLEDLLDGDFSVWSALAGLVQPLFQGGRLRANVDLREAGFEEATAIYAGGALQAFAEVETALAADGLWRNQVAALSVAERNAMAARDLAENRYESGLDDFLGVLETQRQTFEAQSLLLEARRRSLDNRVDLFLALGGGYEAPSSEGGARSVSVTRGIGRAPRPEGVGP